jgi:hypothetical protein
MGLSEIIEPATCKVLYADEEVPI